MLHVPCSFPAGKLNDLSRISDLVVLGLAPVLNHLSLDSDSSTLISSDLIKSDYSDLIPQIDFQTGMKHLSAKLVPRHLSFIVTFCSTILHRVGLVIV